MMQHPLTTYRIQFREDFGFSSALHILDYLLELGVTDLYASPIFKARPGSTHGYDVTDPSRLNPELGSEEEFRALTEAAAHAGMGWLQDVVPNHMAYHGDNPMLADVLENGRNSEYADTFDVDWEHPSDELRGRILAPLLGRPYTECMENGELTLVYYQSGFRVKYFEQFFPLKIESYSDLLAPVQDRVREVLGEHHSDYIKLLDVLHVVRTLSEFEAPYDRQGQSGTEPEPATRRRNQVRFVKQMLAELYHSNPTIQHLIDAGLDAFKGDRGHPGSFDPLDGLLSKQWFRLTHWKVALGEINYKRFMSLNDWISLRIQDERVFRETHSLIADLLRRGIITGLRIDHIDGLFDPRQYLGRLRTQMDAPYVVVENILGPYEETPSEWPVEGTTGYDFLNRVNGLFCDRLLEPEMSRVYKDFTGTSDAPHEPHATRDHSMGIDEMAGDMDNLARMMKRALGRQHSSRDVTFHDLRRALEEIVKHFPVSRTYIDSFSVRESDRRAIQVAITAARSSLQELHHVLDSIERFLLLRFDETDTGEEREEALWFVMRFQQYTAPLITKGDGEAFFYRYNRLISLNEMGGNPARFYGVEPDEFHSFHLERMQRWPRTMNTTATHDTKRGEDVRARINVLSEIPGEWREKVHKWSKLNESLKEPLENPPVPDHNNEYFLYQTMIGALPFCEKEFPEFLERLKGYLKKAAREAKEKTSWINTDSDYEKLLLAFVVKLFERTGSEFFNDFLAFQKRVAHYGVINSLAQCLLKIASPGVADFYQGTELWDLSLGDPDNRNLVDFSRRRKWLKEIHGDAEADRAGLIGRLLANPEDGRIKLFLTASALRARRDHHELFQEGAYLPLTARGRLARHVVAFARHFHGKWAIVAVPRLCTALVEQNRYPLGPEVWYDTHLALPEEAAAVTFSDVFSGCSFPRSVDRILPVADLLSRFPMALLIGKETS